MPIANTRKLAGVLALSIGLTLGACGGMPTNRSLDSVKQPVIERTNYTLDVRAGAGGLSIPEQQRLSGWFEAMDLRYGDRVSIDDPMSSNATREAVSKLASRHGILINQGAPVTAGYVDPGNVRIVITRSNAYVPGCPDWSAKSDMNYNNATSPGYGCATNSNIAAMVANPEDLIKGQEGTGETVVSTSNKAIDSYRNQAPTGEGGLAEGATGGGG
ncbi:CpaD family pilus assembly protein [Pontixanthobacter aestiaquae]|uniref:Pilus assembly protein CpaD n=2 Tax=Pontixanthobacter aestiaquae TaxID=1509367 RepID=A0A844Z6I8_9SPHN|nr:CpaD family pilus assembly protein [Pontixanthobacter aestiaquae]MDN3646076.1 CpaD family pilus assembly protein [Pontixanthobacter aestiaquae]MXO82932.1 pilus assembly protein CpaD [Pontixanthobacter aestiaquae]